MTEAEGQSSEWRHLSECPEGRLGVTGISWLVSLIDLCQFLFDCFQLHQLLLVANGFAVRLFLHMSYDVNVDHQTTPENSYRLPKKYGRPTETNQYKATDCQLKGQLTLEFNFLFPTQLSIHRCVCTDSRTD